MHASYWSSEFHISPPLHSEHITFFDHRNEAIITIITSLSTIITSLRVHMVNVFILGALRGIAYYHNSVAMPRENLHMHTASVMRLSFITHVQKFLHRMHCACAKVFRATAALP